MVTFSSLLGSCFGLVAVVSAYANPGTCSGACVVHDPALIKRASDGVYFRFSTGNKIQIAKASSISGPWTNVGSVVPAGSSINLAGNQDLWAPDVHLVGSTYYLYYAVSTFGSQNSAIGYATSNTLEAGSWTDHGSTGIASASGKPYNAIDANLIQLSNGGYQMNFGSFWGDIYQVPMSSPSSKGSNSASGPLIYDPSGTHAVEGAFMYLHGGLYYLFWSAGICCGLDKTKPAAGKEYKIKVCASSSPTGPFTDKNGVACNNGGGTVVLESHDKVYAPGGQGVMADSSLGTILYYHYSNTAIGLGDGQTQFGWNVIGWSGGWPSV